MKRFIRRHGVAILLTLIAISTISLSIFLCTDEIVNTLNDNNYNILEQKVNLNYVTNTTMIGKYSPAFKNTPVNAQINNKILHVTAKLKNATAYDIKFQDYGISTYGGYEIPAKVKFSDKDTIKKDEVLEIEFITNISFLKNLNVLPTEYSIKFGGTDNISKNYHEFELDYVISWNI